MVLSKESDRILLPLRPLNWTYCENDWLPLVELNPSPAALNVWLVAPGAVLVTVSVL